MSSVRIASLLSLALLLPIALPLVPTAVAAGQATPAPVASFAVLQHPTSAGDGAGEPTVGMNPETGAVLFMDGSTVWKVGLDTNTWTAVTPPNSIVNVDPMLFTDLGTGRTFAGGLDGECSIMSFTDDDGASWTPAGNQCAGAWDHQTIGQGPWREPRPELASFDRATYYCAQAWISWPANACVTSLDGGLTYLPPSNWAGPCKGLHGHVNVSPDGRAYVPTRSCGGVAGYGWTEDNGATWQSKQHPAGMAAPGSGFDSSIGASIDGDTLYFAFERNDWIPMVSRSDDDGATWTAPVAVGADAGVKTATFLRVVSGDPDRVVLTYLGSTTDGNPFVNGWPGVWHLYTSFSYDGGATWSTVRVTTDPVQRGWMCAGGTSCGSGRNLLDFIGHTLTPDGQLIVGFADGCVGACALSTGQQSQSTSSWSTLAVQTSGRGLFAEHDPAGVDVVGSLVAPLGSPVALTATVEATLPYDATILWGDGQQDVLVDLMSSPLTVEHTYAAAGTYDVTVQIQGADGAMAQDTAQARVEGSTTGASIEIREPAQDDVVGATVLVSGVANVPLNSAPEAAFSFTTSGLAADFDASATTDAEGDVLVLAWDFGDSTSGEGATVSHTYAAPGTYDVCLTASDGELSDELCQSVTLSSASTRLVTDPSGDAVNPLVRGTPAATPNVATLDILAVDATATPEGEPVFTITINSMSAVSPPLQEGADGAIWRVEWDGPAAAGVDFVQMNAAMTTSTCGYGDNSASANLYQQKGTAPCSVTPGTPAKITLTYPAAAMATRGYTGGETLSALRGSSLVYRGIPQDAPVSAGGTTEYDTTGTVTHTLPASSFPAALVGLGEQATAKPAPSTPPSDPQITDKVNDNAFELLPHVNIQSAWFDSDADYLYVGVKVQDVPADATTTAYVSYRVNFKPGWTPADATWGGLVPSGATFQGLRVLALYSPVAMTGIPSVPHTQNATRFELQVLYTQTTARFGTIAQLQGSIDPATDIIWFVVPRTTLQNPGSGDAIVTPDAIAAPAIAGAVSFNNGDTTGTGSNYVFPGQPVSQPVVTLAAAPASGVAPLLVTFTMGVTPASVATWSLDFGDGSAPATGAGSLPATLAHEYTAAGDFVASLTVTAPDSGQGTATASVSVTPGGGSGVGRVLVSAPGIDAVEATCGSGCATWTAQLDLSSLADGAVPITARLVQNGQTVATDDITVVLEKTVEVAIDSPTDSAVVGPGALTVTGRLAGATDLPPQAVLSADTTRGVAPLRVTFTLEGQDDLGVASWSFNSGNGYTEMGTSLPATIVRDYEVGTYTATLDVTDTAGRVDSASVSIESRAANLPPTAPAAPSPADGATGRSPPVLLSWSASDPDGDTLSYDVYLDTTDASTLVATDQTASFLASGLAASTTYFWKVVASDGIASTEGPVWSFTTAAPVLGESSRPHVVVAVIDTGGNPYHLDWRRAGLVDHPSTYLTDFPAEAAQVDLCFYDAATKTVDQNRCTGSPSTMMTTTDLAQWQEFRVTPTSQVGAGQGNIAWFPGTNLMFVSFGHNGDARFPGMDGSFGAGDSHGTSTSSNVGGATTGTCPECIVVVIEGDTVPAIEAAYQWAANQPWIDVITSSISIGVVGLGVNPGDFFEATAASTRMAVEDGKIVFEAAGNGVGNAGIAPMSTFLYANGNPWTIPVGCSAEHSGQACLYHDFPNAVTASGMSRVSALPDSYTAVDGVGGTSFSSPTTAGVTARALYAVRSVMGDTGEGPADSATKTLVRAAPGVTLPATGPLADGSLTKLELEEALFKTARRSAVPTTPWYIFPVEVPNSPAGWVKEGFGNVYRGDYGVGYANALPTWSSSGDAAAVILGQKQLPARWVEEFWWESIVTPVQVAIFGDEPAETDADAFPRNDPIDPMSVLGYTPQMRNADSLGSEDVPVGHVPTTDNRRVYLHTSTAEGVAEMYMNTIADPAAAVADADVTGVGATGIVPVGGASPTLTFEMRYPQVDGTLLLDEAKDVVVHVEATGIAGGPATPATLRYVLSANGAIVGSGVAVGVKRAGDTVYEASFKPAFAAVLDPIVLHLAWEGPVASMHVETQGASYMDMPVLATLAQGEPQTVQYYLDNFAGFSTNGGTVTLTRDANALTGDADKNSYFPFPQATGVTINLAANDNLVDEPTLLGAQGAAVVYLCTNQADVGAAIITAKVDLYAGGIHLGGGSLTKEMVGLNTGRTVPVVVPLAMKSFILPENVPLLGAINLGGPQGAFTQNMGLCGGGATKPWSVSLSLTELGLVPSVTVDIPGEPLAGTQTFSGTADFPEVPSAAAVTWHVKDAADWFNQDIVLTMETTGPGTDSGGPLLEPDPDGFRMVAKSARPVFADAAMLSQDTVGTAQFWVTGIGGSTNVKVDMSVYLENAAGAQRLLGSGSITKHVMSPLGSTDFLPSQSFVLDFVPLVNDPQPGEKLVFEATATNLGPASDSRITCWCGDDVRPVFVSLPKLASPAAVDPTVRLELGNLVQMAPVVDGAWSMAVDTTAVQNGDSALSVTPFATYGGVERTGLPFTATVRVTNTQQNAPPTATLSVTPLSGVAPLEVSATLGGSDAQTAAAALQYTMDWGDGSAVVTGTGLPATLTHTYTSEGLYTPTLVVRDAGNDVSAPATAAVTAMAPPPAKKVVVMLDGGAPVDATATSADFARWTAQLDLPAENGMHSITARHVRGEEILSEASITVNVHVPELPELAIATPAEGARVAGGAITGTTDGVLSVEAALDADFTGAVQATTTDGFLTWSVDLAQLALAEDVETTVYVRATNADGTTKAFRTLTLDAAPNAAILVTPESPLQTGEAFRFDASTSPSASGAAVNAFLWSFGDNTQSSEANPTHAYARGGEYTVTLTVTDENGASGSATRALLVLDRAPDVTLAVAPEVITTADTATLTASATDPEGTLTTVGITVYDGETTDAEVLATGSETLSVRFPDDGQFLAVARATDADGSSAEFHALVTVFNVRPTALLTASPLVVGVGQDVTFDASGSADPDGSIVEYRFDVGDGTEVVVQETPVLAHRYGASGIYEATVTVVDDDGSQITSAPVTVRANAGPTLAAIGHQAADEGTTMAFVATATDPEGDALTFSLTPLPAGATFDNATGAFSWAIQYGQAGNYPVTVSVTDGRLADSEEIILSVGDVNLPPSLVPIGAKLGLENEMLAFSIEATDPDTPIAFTAAPLPAGAIFDGETGAFLWTPSYTQAGVYDVLFTVRDGFTTLSELVVITIANNDRLPVLNPVASATVYQTESIDLALAASDADGEIISFAHDGPTGMTIVDQGAGKARLRWTPGIDIAPGAYTIRVFAIAGEATATRETTIRVLFKTAVAVSTVGGANAQASPDEVVTLVARVTNTGPNTDTFSLRVLNTQGWGVSEVPETITLAPGEAQDVSIEVTVDGSKPISWTYLYATSTTDASISKSARFRVDVPVVVEIDGADAIAAGLALPAGVIRVTHLDGTPAVGANVRVIETPALFSALRTQRSGTTDENGEFEYDFTGEPGSMLPGQHTLTVVASKVGGFETAKTATYRIGVTV